MQISEIRVKLVEKRNDRLKAFCSVTFDDDFVIRDLKIIEGASGYFVAMPSRKISDRCPNCRCKNHLRAKFCNECGKRLEDDCGGDYIYPDFVQNIEISFADYLRCLNFMSVDARG